MNPPSTQTASNTGDPSQLLYIEDMQEGDVWLSEPREISADDVADFAMLTGDHDPLHAGDNDDSPFGEPVAHGLLGLSVMAGLSSERPNTATLALVSVDGWEFLAPIFFGDQIHVRTVLETKQPHGRRAAKVTWFRQLINQTGRVVQQGRLTTLVATRKRTPPAPKSNRVISPGKAK
ncbi:MAG: MaoC/PaaZ C-terminal domain-containing protein [Planctomycetota bacterium]